MTAKKSKETGKSKKNPVAKSGKRKPQKKKSKNRKKKGGFFKTVIIVIAFIIIGRAFLAVSDNRKIDYMQDYREEFIEKIKPMAISEYKETGILPSITMAQAALESNWGRSALAVQGKNLFGIKAGKSWNGKTIVLRTREYNNTYINSAFRAYDSWDESIKDHSALLSGNKVYLRRGVFDSKNYREQAKALERAGYATDADEKGNPVYAKKLISIIERYGFYEVDDKVKNSRN